MTIEKGVKRRGHAAFERWPIIALNARRSPIVEEELKTMIPASWRQHLVIEIDRGTQMGKHGGQNLIGRAVYDGQYKYVIYDWGRYREQLFDLTADSGEMVNLAGSSHFTPVLASKRSCLRTWCEETGDRFVAMIPSGDGPAPY